MPIQPRKLPTIAREAAPIGSPPAVNGCAIARSRQLQTDYPSLKAQTLYALSVAYQAQGETAKAEQTATEALSIRTAMATFQGWDIATLEPGESLEPWDQTLLRVGDAIADIQGAIATYQELNQVADEVNARRYLGHLYEQIGLSSQAQDQFDQTEARQGSLSTVVDQPL